MFLFFKTNTFQAVLTTDGSLAYAVLVYNCDNMQWSGDATIGFNSDGSFFNNYDMSGTPTANLVACRNQPDSVWSSIIFQLGKHVQ